MFVFIAALPLIAVSAAGLMLWPGYLAPLWAMYRDGDFAWAESQGVTAPRLSLIGAGAAVFVGFVAAAWVVLFVSVNPLVVLSPFAVIAGAPALGLGVLTYRALTVRIFVWFNDGSELGGRITSRQPLRVWHDADARAFMPTDGGESIWLYAPDTTADSELAHPDKWRDFKAPDFLATAGQDASLFFARCDTSALRRNSNRRNKQSVKAETIRASIILAFAGLFGLLGFLGMTAGAPGP